MKKAVARSLSAGVILAGWSVVAQAQSPEAAKARAFDLPTLVQARNAAADMADAPAVPAKLEAADFQRYAGDYELVESRKMKSPDARCLKQVRIELRGSLLVIEGRAGAAYAGLAEFDLSEAEAGALSRPAPYEQDSRGSYMYRLSSARRSGSLVLQEYVEGELEESATFSASVPETYIRSVPWWGECVYRKAAPTKP